MFSFRIYFSIYIFFFYLQMKQSEKVLGTAQFLYFGFVFFFLYFSVSHTYLISLAAEPVFFLRTEIKWQDKLFVQHSLKYIFTSLSYYYMSLSLWLSTLSVVTVMCYFTAIVWIF